MVFKGSKTLYMELKFFEVYLFYLIVFLGVLFTDVFIKKFYVYIRKVILQSF